MIHGGDVEGYISKYNRMPLDFSANVNPFGMPDAVKHAVIKALDRADRYPDPLCRKLAAALSVKEEVPQEDILCGNGAADLIYRLVLALKPKRAVIPFPTFGEYEQALKLVGCRVYSHFLKPERAFLLDESILEALTPKVNLLFLCNPNNPTGQVIAPELLDSILRRCARQKITVLLDECFQGFLAPEFSDSRVRELDRYPNLVILKAFTKLYAMAGVRLGYLLCSDTTLINRCAVTGQPWAVSSLAQAAGIAALKEAEYLKTSQDYICREREWMKNRLSRLGITCIGSYANYLFFRSPIEFLPLQLEQEGILIRSCDNYRGMPPGYCRVAVRTREENEILIETLKKIRKA